MAFTDTLADDAAPLFDDVVDHPMVAALGDGTLDEAPFRRWLRQDYRYLTDYARVFAYGAANAPGLDRMRRLATLLSETLETEMDLHRAYAAEFGITEAELAATEPTPTTRGYTDFLVRTAATGTFGDLAAALLPCMWGYHDTAVRLRERGRPDDERYAEWVETYAGEEFAELTTWCKGLVDDVAAGRPERDRKRYRDLFRTSLRYEYRFWDAAWTGEEWV